MDRVGRKMRMAAGAAATLILTTGCATLLGGGPSQSVTVNAEPAGTSFVVKSSSGLQMAAGTAPQIIRLPRRNEYQVDFTVPGYQPQSVVLTRGVNGWIWGNLVIGWIVGFIVDFATGSAYKLEPAVVQVALQPRSGEGTESEAHAVVRLLDMRGRVISEARVRLEPTR
jgi:hypothetical protein